MARIIRVGGAQLGPLQKSDNRAVAVRRMLQLLDQAHAAGCTFVVYPELALTTFFPRWNIEDPEEVACFFETEMPGPETAPLFERAREYGIGFHLGYAEAFREGGDEHHFNTAIMVDPQGEIVGKYRKIHLPGHAQYDPDRAFQHLEKKYFQVGDLGFPVWRTMDGLFGMCICNDRRWPETYRVMGLQGVEMIVLGFNTPNTNPQRPDEDDDIRVFHSDLCIQSGAYQNGTFVVAVAKAGSEDGHVLLGDSIIAHPSGKVLARSKTLEDELIVADCDLDDTRFYKESVFDFARHRRPEHYGRIVAQTGATPPE